MAWQDQFPTVNDGVIVKSLPWPKKVEPADPIDSATCPSPGLLMSHLRAARVWAQRLDLPRNATGCGAREAGRCEAPPVLPEDPLAALVVLFDYLATLP